MAMHFKTQKERLDYLKGNFEEIKPIEIKPIEAETAKNDAETEEKSVKKASKSKKKAKKEQKDDTVSAE